MAKKGKKGPTQAERDKASGMAGQIVNPAALNMALTHSLTMGTNSYGNSVAGNLFTEAVKTQEGAGYAGQASANAAGGAYAAGKNVMGSSFSNADVAEMAYNGVIGSGAYTQLNVGQIAELYGVEDVDPSIAGKQIDQLNPENEAEASALLMYDAFTKSMENRAVETAVGMDNERMTKNLANKLGPKKSK